MDTDTQSAAHLAMAQLLEVHPPHALQPSITALDLQRGLPLAPWAQRLAVAAAKGPLAAVAAAGGRGAAQADMGVPGARALVLGRMSVGGGADLVGHVALSVARRILPHLATTRQEGGL